MAYRLIQARSADEALTHIRSGSFAIISRIDISELFNRAALVRDGIFDFDGTLTEGSQWRSVGELMPESLRSVDIENYQWYHDHLHDQDVQDVSLDDPDWWIGHLETGNKLAVDGAWLAATVYMLRLSGVTKGQIQSAAKSLQARQGVTPLIKSLRNKAVISFGMEQFIQSWLEHHQIEIPVAASRILFDEEDIVDRVHINIVGSGSKEFAAARFRRISGSSDRELMVVGDSVVDIHMMSQSSFNVLIIPPSELKKKMKGFRENNLEVMWNRVTMILASDSFDPLLQFFKTASRQSHR